MKGNFLIVATRALFGKGKMNKNCSKNTLGATETVDTIERIVYEQLKTLGFRKHGRTLHRFVSGDISQLIHFQIGPCSAPPYDSIYVNIGIRVPECMEALVPGTVKGKKYYHEYECNIRSRLGIVAGGKEKLYSLQELPEVTAQQILDEFFAYVLPAFEVMNSRENILQHRKEYPNMDWLPYPLDDAIMYLGIGDKARAKESFEAYYEKAVKRHEYEKEHGTTRYMKKGDRIITCGVEICADKDGYYTIPGPKESAHIKSIEEMAVTLGLR